MLFDKKEHRELVLQLIETANIPGKLLDTMYDLRLSVLQAKLAGVPEPKLNYVQGDVVVEDSE